MTEIDEREKNVSRAFAISMKLIQAAIKAKHHPDQQQEILNEFSELLDLARADIASAAIPKNERLLTLMDKVNKERVAFLKEKIKYQQAGFEKVAQNYQTIVDLSEGACKYLSYLYQNHLPSEVLPVKKYTINIPIVHDEVPLDTIVIKFNDINLPHEKGVVYNILCTHPIDPQTTFKSPNFDNNPKIECEFDNLGVSKPAKLKSAKLNISLVQKKKMIFTKKETLLSYDLNMREFDSKSTFEHRITVPPENKKSPYYISFTAQLRKPITTPEVEEKTILVHVAPAGAPKQAKPAPAAAPTPAAAAAPKPKPKAAAPAGAAAPQKPQGPPDPPFQPLEEWEWNNFVAPPVLDKLINQATLIENFCVKYKKPIQPGLKEQKERAQKEMEAFQAKFEDGDFSPQDYIKMLQDSIAKNEAKAKTMDKSNPYLGEFLARIQFAKDDLQSMLQPE